VQAEALMKIAKTIRAPRMGERYFMRALSIAVCLAPLALGGCQDVGFNAAVPSRMAPGVPIAVEGIEGPPAEVASALTDALTQAAAQHQVTVVEDSQGPRFRLKGYLTASMAQDGKTALAYVWDLFDASNRRAQRVTGVEEAASDPADPWSSIDNNTLRRLAGKSMDGIADFLANAGTGSSAAAAASLGPRAVTTGAATGALVGAGSKPLGYASPE
jgi:hypothetical protein